MTDSFDALDQDAAEVIFETMTGGDYSSYTPPGGGAAINVYAILSRGVEIVASFSEVVERADTVALLRSQVNAVADAVVTIQGVDYKLDALIENDQIETTWRVTRQ